jgi:hypothetical protein
MTIITINKNGKVYVDENIGEDLKVVEDEFGNPTGTLL